MVVIIKYNNLLCVDLFVLLLLFLQTDVLVTQQN